MQRRLAFLLLQPSGASVFITTLLWAVLLWGSSQTTLQRHVQFYKDLFGDGGSLQDLQVSLIVHTGHIGALLFSSTTNYRIVVLAFAAFVGIVTFLGLQFLSSLMGNIHESGRQNTTAGDRHMSRERSIVQVGTFLAGIVYTVLSIRLLIPYCVYISRNGILELDVRGALLLMAGSIGFYLLIHVHVVLLRLLLLRPRLVGGTDAILMVLAKS